MREFFFVSGQKSRGDANHMVVHRYDLYIIIVIWIVIDRPMDERKSITVATWTMTSETLLAGYFLCVHNISFIIYHNFSFRWRERARTHACTHKPYYIIFILYEPVQCKKKTIYLITTYIPTVRIYILYIYIYNLHIL